LSESNEFYIINVLTIGRGQNPVKVHIKAAASKFFGGIHHANAKENKIRTSAPSPLSNGVILVGIGVVRYGCHHLLVQKWC
jgi:uncharacterized protein (UPF0548 family)